MLERAGRHSDALELCHDILEQSDVDLGLRAQVGSYACRMLVLRGDPFVRHLIYKSLYSLAEAKAFYGASMTVYHRIWCDGVLRELTDLLAQTASFRKEDSSSSEVSRPWHGPRKRGLWPCIGHCVRLLLEFLLGSCLVDYLSGAELGTSDCERRNSHLVASRTPVDELPMAPSGWSIVEQLSKVGGLDESRGQYSTAPGVSSELQAPSDPFAASYTRFDAVSDRPDLPTPLEPFTTSTDFAAWLNNNDSSSEPGSAGEGLWESCK